MLFYFRVRPLNKKELKNGDDSVVSFPGSGQIIVSFLFLKFKFSFMRKKKVYFRILLKLDTQSIGQKSKIFTYNVVFEPLATQEDILQHSGIKRLIEMAVEGYNCTAFCYGQTGSGKTHTLTGPPGLVSFLILIKY